MICMRRRRTSLVPRRSWGLAHAATREMAGEGHQEVVIGQPDLGRAEGALPSAVGEGKLGAGGGVGQDPGFAAGRPAGTPVVPALKMPALRDGGVIMASSAGLSGREGTAARFLGFPLFVEFRRGRDHVAVVIPAAG